MISRAKTGSSNHRKTTRESRGVPRESFLGADTGRARSDSRRIKTYAEWHPSRFLEGGYPRKPIITIPISIYRHWDGDDVEEEGSELHPHDRSALKAIRDALAKYEFEPILIIGCISERVICINVETTYDREVTGEDEHTLECHDEILKGLINRSYVPYHCGIRSVALHPEPEDDHGKRVGMLQKTILPPSANH